MNLKLSVFSNLNMFSNKFTGNFIDIHTENLIDISGNDLTVNVTAGTVDIKGPEADFEHGIAIDDGIKIGDEIHIVNEIVTATFLRTRKVHKAGGSGATILKALWQKTKFTLSSPVLCQSISLKIENTATNTGNTFGIKINDISIEYRIFIPL